jgi:hypothetical protein
MKSCPQFSLSKTVLLFCWMSFILSALSLGTGCHTASSPVVPVPSAQTQRTAITRTPPLPVPLKNGIAIPKPDTAKRILALKAQLEKCDAELKNMPPLVLCLDDLIPLNSRLAAIDAELTGVQEEEKIQSLRNERASLVKKATEIREMSAAGESRLPLEEERFRILEEMKKLQAE